MRKQNKLLKEQAEHFGIENRMLQCTEELSELIQALSKYRRVEQGDKTCMLIKKRCSAYGSRRNSRCRNMYRTIKAPTM